jgi:multisubunit Na+/H+ antiporter MnhB subunit
MWKIIKKIYIEVREFLWPVLEGEPKKPNVRSASQILDQLKKEIDSDKIKRLFEVSKEISEREEKRRATVESKATTLLGATGLTITLIVGFGKSLFVDYANSPDIDLFTVYIFSFFFLLSILYLSRSIHFSLKALSRTGFHTLRHKDVTEMDGLSAGDYDKKIAATILENTSNNYPIVNEKVDWMVMSQEYFRRGVFSVIVAALILSVKVYIFYLFLYVKELWG